MIGRCPAETGSRKVPLLIGRQQGRETEFVAVLFPYRGRPDLAVARHGNEITISHGNLSDVLTLPSDGSRPALVRRAR